MIGARVSRRNFGAIAVSKTRLAFLVRFRPSRGAWDTMVGPTHGTLFSVRTERQCNPARAVTISRQFTLHWEGIKGAHVMACQLARGIPVSSWVLEQPHLLSLAQRPLAVVLSLPCHISKASAQAQLQDTIFLLRTVCRNRTGRISRRHRQAARADRRRPVRHRRRGLIFPRFRVARALRAEQRPFHRLVNWKGIISN